MAEEGRSHEGKEEEIMNNHKGMIGIIIGLVVLIGGASFLYGSLSQGVDAGRLKVTQTQSSGEAESSGEEAGAGSTDSIGDPGTEAAESEAADAGASGDEASGSEASGTKEEAAYAPDFTVYDQEGNAVRLSDYRGKPVVLNFWASWCGPCRSEMPDFDEAYQEMGDEIQFLMVNLTDGSRETVEGASEFVKEQGYSFPILFDSSYEASTAYQVFSIPTTIFIDAEGYGAAQASGAIDREILQEGIDMIWKPSE